MKKGVKIAVAAVIVLVLVGAGCGWYFLYEKPHSEAVAEFEAVAETVDAKNAELAAAVDSAQALIDEGGQPLEPTTVSDLQTSITTARAALREVPEMPSGTEDILAAADELGKPLDCSGQMSELDDKKKALEDSIAQMAQVTNPPEAFVVERLQAVPTITGMAAVTEDHDPNGNLNKSGGYTACVYFSESQVDRSKIYNDSGDIIEVGTDGGGCIEVYATAEEAEKRRAYLAGFDGSILANGSHSVVGTVLVRTSNYLTATQQGDLEKQIMDALIELR